VLNETNSQFSFDSRFSLLDSRLSTLTRGCGFCCEPN